METIAQLMCQQAPQEGVNPTGLPGVHLYRASTSQKRQPLCYAQGIIIVGQGTKQVHLGDKSLVYDPDHYLVLSVPLPAECETRATPARPMLSLFMDLDLGLIRDLIRALPQTQPRQGGDCGLAVARMTPELSDAVLRLLKALASDLETRVLGPGLVREILFRVLQGENSRALGDLARAETRISRVDKALKSIHDNFSSPMTVDDLAALVHMSPSAFYRAFKEVTASSPVQYIKKIRLDRAKTLLTDQGLRVSQAAAQVGYESPNQFSREFKRHFGSSPVACLGRPSSPG